MISDINFLKNASRCVLKDKNDVRAHYLGYIFIKLVDNDLDIVSTDGKTLYKKQFKNYVPEEEDKKFLQEGVMVKFDFTKIKLKHGSVKFNFKEKYFEVYENRELKDKFFYETTDKAFPDYNKVIPCNEKSKLPEKYYRFNFQQYKTLEENDFLHIMPKHNVEGNEYALLFEKTESNELMVLMSFIC